MTAKRLVRLPELKECLKTQILPNLNSDWTLFREDTVVRTLPWLLSGVHFYRLRGEKIRPVNFIQLYAIPASDLDLTISRPIMVPAPGILNRLLASRITLVLSWPIQDQELKRIVDLIKEQIKPSYGSSIKANELNDWLSEEFENSQHPYVLWTRGIVSIMSGKKEMGISILKNSASKYSEGSSQL